MRLLSTYFENSRSEKFFNSVKREYLDTDTDKMDSNYFDLVMFVYRRGGIMLKYMLTSDIRVAYQNVNLPLILVFDYFSAYCYLVCPVDEVFKGFCLLDCCFHSMKHSLNYEIV